MTDKTRSELLSELGNLEIKLQDAKRRKKEDMNAFRDEIKDLEEHIKQVVQQLKEKNI